MCDLKPLVVYVHIDVRIIYITVRSHNKQGKNTEKSSRHKDDIHAHSVLSP